MRTIYWATWELDEVADRRFRRITAAVAIPLLIAAVLITIFQLQGAKKGGGTFHSGRYVELLPTQKPAPPAPPAAKPEQPKPLPKPQTKPPQEAKVQPVPKPQTKPVPKPKPHPVPHKTRPHPTPAPPKPRETARQKAEKALAASGLGALSDLRDKNLPTVNGSQPLVSGAITSKGGVGGGEQSFQRSATESSNAPAGYGSAEVTRRQSGEGLGHRKAGTVSAPHGFGPDHTRPGDNGKNDTGRTLEEIQLVFDRHKAAFYALYNRARREHPSLQGKIVVSLTIAPDGHVTAAHIVASQLHDPQMEQQVLQMVRSLKFKPKNVPAFTYPNYPIYFQPS
jgi:TonB family C-terminal domain